jgi:hypothetical protein
MSTPARSLKSSPAMCWMLPTPEEAKESLPGFFFRKSIIARTSANLCFGWWQSICGVMPMSAIGVKSSVGWNLPFADHQRADGVGVDVRYLQRVAVGRRLGDDVGADRPGGAGLVVDDHRLAERSPSLAPTRRPIASAPPPGGNPTISLIGFEGHGACAHEGSDCTRGVSDSAATTCLRFWDTFIGFSPVWTDNMTQLRIPAVYMRGGTSKGVFFRAEDLPADRAARDRFLLRVVGSPDPYGKQIDGMGAATSSTSKVVILSPSRRPGFDVDYLFGQVAIDRALIDWSGNCGNLTAGGGAVRGLAGLGRRAGATGSPPVNIWQANIAKRIVAHVPVRAGEVVEEGDFVLDGVAFPGGGDPHRVRRSGRRRRGCGARPGAMFPTGRLVDTLDVPGVGRVEATLVTAGNPTVFVDAAAVGLQGHELQAR